MPQSRNIFPNLRNENHQHFIFNLNRCISPYIVRATLAVALVSPIALFALVALVVALKHCKAICRMEGAHHFQVFWGKFAVFERI